MILDELSIPQIEHIMNLWAGLHPHSVEAQVAAAKKVYSGVTLLNEDEEE